MKFKVPQDVQREDKIVAFLTLRHLIILGLGGGSAYALYITLAKNYFWEIWAPPVFIISILTLAVAFFKIRGDIPFLDWILLQSAFLINTQKRTWQKMSGDVFISEFSKKHIRITKEQKKAQQKGLEANKKFKSLNELTEILDTHGTLNKTNTKDHE